MMGNMMPGSMMDSGMLFWTVLGILLFLALVAVAIWLLANWLNSQRTHQRMCTPQPKDAYQEYEQGYQPVERIPEPYPEAGELPQAQYQRDDAPLQHESSPILTGLRGGL